MFGLATTTELRLAFYGVVLAAIAGLLLYERHEGAAGVEAQQKAAVTADTSKQHQLDQDTISDLQTKLAATLQPAPVPVVRLCGPAGSVRAAPAAAGTQPALAPAARGSADGVPAGTSGIDIGPSLSAAQRAAEVIALYRDATWDWALKQSH